MSENEAKEKLQAYIKCQESQEPADVLEQCDKNCTFCELCYAQGLYGEHKEAVQMAINALEEIQQYRAIGTVEELQKAQEEEKILKFYYCDTEDSYLLGRRVGNFYYAHYCNGHWVFDMSRYLPWGKHVVEEGSLWKECTYPSEPKEIDFHEWLDGFIKKECGGTLEECRAAVEKQKAKKVIDNTPTDDDVWYQCPTCDGDLTKIRGLHCPYCGQKLNWRDEE